MAKIRYLQRTHDSKPGDVKCVDDRCAAILVTLEKAEYFVERQSSNHKKKNKAENG
ncbi:hypothetical protein JBO42_04040 [Enterobacter asburiae]|nr:hypothetical protein [Enterobacter asburiae]